MYHRATQWGQLGKTLNIPEELCNSDFLHLGYTWNAETKLCERTAEMTELGWILVQKSELAATEAKHAAQLEAAKRDRLMWAGGAAVAGGLVGALVMHLSMK